MPACGCAQFSSGGRFTAGILPTTAKRWVEVNGPITVGEMPLAIHAAEAGLGLAYVYASYAAAGLAAGRFAPCWTIGDPRTSIFICITPAANYCPLACGRL